MTKVSAEEGRRSDVGVSNDRLLSPSYVVTSRLRHLVSRLDSVRQQPREVSDEAPRISTHRPLTAGETSPPAAASNFSDVDINKGQKVERGGMS